MSTNFESCIVPLPCRDRMNLYVRISARCLNALVFFGVFVLTLAPGCLLWAQDIAQVKKGVVKIVAQVEGKNRVGSGVIVKVEEDRAYIVTASHIIEWDQHPNVFFFSAPPLPCPRAGAGRRGPRRDGDLGFRLVQDIS